MANEGPKKGFAFVIDTNSYAGNFEREMTAYLTGIIGECEVGEEFVEDEVTEKFDQYILQVPDDHGCYRPTTIWIEPTTNQYNSVAIFFYDKPTQDQIDFMKERVKNFNEIYNKINGNRYSNLDGSDIEKIKVLGFKLIEFISENKEIPI